MDLGCELWGGGSSVVVMVGLWGWLGFGISVAGCFVGRLCVSLGGLF